MISLPHIDGAPQRMKYTRRRGRVTAALALASALAASLATTGCSVLGPRPPGAFSSLAETLPVVLAQGNGLCVGQGRDVAACGPRPQPKRLALDGLRVGLLRPGNEPQTDQPAYVFCRVKREPEKALLECAEIYTRLPG